MSILGKLEEVLSCGDIDPFIKTIRRILQYKGFSDSKFFLCEVGRTEFLVKLAFYRKTNPELYLGSGEDDALQNATQNATQHTTGGKSSHRRSSRRLSYKSRSAAAIKLKNNEIKSQLNPNETELQILLILKREIIEANVSPCILELLAYKQCRKVPHAIKCAEFMPHSQTIPNAVRSMFCKHKQMVDAGLSYEMYNFLVLEECDITLHEFLVKHVRGNAVAVEMLTSFLFTILCTLAAIKHRYPKFIHGDLHTENIMLKFEHGFSFNASAVTYLSFDIAGQIYNVPYFGIIAKIIDFGFACIPEKKIVSSIESDRAIKYLRTPHDVLFLLYDIYDLVGTDHEIVKTLELIEPEETWRQYNTATIKKMRRLRSELDMLDSKCFEKYIVKKPETSIIHTFHCF
jgi:hypothetical protein